MCNFECKSIKNKHTYHFFTLVLVVAFSVFSISRLGQLRFDYDFEAFFPNENDELAIYQHYRQTFEYDNEFILLALENKAGIFKKEFLEQVDSLSERLKRIPNVKQVNSPTRLAKLSFGGILPNKQSWLHIDDESAYSADSTAIYANATLVGSYFPQNAKSLCLFIKTDDELSKTKSDELAAAIESHLLKFHFDGIHYVGRIFAQNVYLEKLKKEFTLFLCISLLVVILFLWLSFKTLYGVLVPLSITVVSILWTMGIMYLMDKPIDLMCTMLPTMIFIAGMSDVVHFFSKHFEELEKGTAGEKIYPLILKEVGFPTFLTLVTTVVGFLSLLFSSIQPIREFGIYTSVGVVIAFILTYTLLPALLYFFPPKKMAHAQKGKPLAEKLMRSSLFWIFRNQVTIVLITGVLILLSVIGITKISVNNILLEDLSDKVKIKQDFIFFDNNYSGARPFELQLTIKEKHSSVWDYNVLKKIYQIDSFIKKEYHAGFVISPAAVVLGIQNTLMVSDNMFPSPEDYETIYTYIRSNKKNKDLKKIVQPDGRLCRISAKIKDEGSIKINANNTRLLQYLEKNGLNRIFDFQLTGAAHLIDRNNAYMVSNMTQGFVFSVIVIALLTFFLHRSWRMVLVFILPNIIPLCIIGGIMGFAHIELKAATSLVFSIAFGIATDDTIHFISRLKIELAYGKSILYAFKRTYFETGKPIILTTFILLGGFMSLMLSDFKSTFYFGFLICITVLIAVLADLFLLPVLLFLIYRNKSSKK